MPGLRSAKRGTSAARRGKASPQSSPTGERETQPDRRAGNTGTTIAAAHTPEGDAVLRTPLIHPPLLAALAGAGHGGKVLIADANYSASTNVNPAAARIHLNVRPGLVTVADVLEPVLATVPVEAVEVMTPPPPPGSWPAPVRARRPRSPALGER